MELTKNGPGFLLHCGDYWCWDMHLDLNDLGCISLENTDFQVFDDNIEGVKEYIKNRNHIKYKVKNIKKELKGIKNNLRKLDKERNVYLSKIFKLNEQLTEFGEGAKFNIEELPDWM